VTPDLGIEADFVETSAKGFCAAELESTSWNQHET